MAKKSSLGSLLINLELQTATLNKQVNGINKKFDNMSRGFKNTAKLLASVFAVRELIRFSDEWSNLTARLKLASSSTEEFTKAQVELFAIAQDSRTSLSATVNLYAKLARSTDALGVSSKDLLKVTETISKAMTISGASTTEANSALLQLSQGMASGVLRGEELNSVMENTPRLAIAIADGLGVSIGKLRAMGKEGLLTTEVIITALQSQSQTIQAEFTQIPQTVGASMVKLENAVLSTVGQIAKAFSSTEGLSGAIDFVTEAITNSKEGIIEFGAFAVVVLERTKILFEALGRTILDAILKKAGGSAETNKAWEQFFGYDIITETIKQLEIYNKALKGLDVSKLTSSIVEVEKVAEKAKDSFKDIQFVFTNAFSNMENKMVQFAKTGKLAFSDFVGAIMEDLLRMIIRLNVTIPLMRALQNSGMFFGGGGGGATPTGDTGGMGWGFAKGGAFAGGVQQFASGGIVSSPTRFGMAGGTGIMGEAGAEAIMPLTRTSNGDLGIKAIGGGGGTTVNVYNQSGADTEVQQNTDSNGNDIIDIMIKSTVEKGLGNGTFDKALGLNFGLNRKGY